MDRREFLHTTAMTALAAKVLGDALPAAAQTPAPAAPPLPRRLILDAYTRCLHWIRDADQIAEAALEITCTGVNPTIQSYPGHIDPAKVAQQLPPFVKTMQKHGLRVKQVRGGNQTQVDATVEAMVGTMGQLGVTHYWIGTDNYDLAKPILPQLDAIKLKVERFVRLNEKHGTTLLYHTRAGAGSVGSVVWDLLYVMKDFDPRFVGFHWDTGHMALHGGNMWELLMRTAAPYVSAMGWKDRGWEQNAARPGEGGRGGRRGGGAAGPGRGGGWSSPQVPMGTGLVDVFRYAAVMRDIGFNGPMELQAEYPNGGSENGADTITLPREQVLGNLKRDVLAIRTAFEQSGTGLTIAGPT